MKKVILIILSICFSLLLQAQVSKTVNVTTAGSLDSLLTANQLATVTNLTLTGTIDSLDFLTMRDNMPALAVLDLSGVTIVGNALPNQAFYNENTDWGKVSLTTITLPKSLTRIGYNAFVNCTGLTAISIPASVTEIGTVPFGNCSAYITVDANNHNYSSSNGVLFDKNQSTLISCPISLTGSYTIPSTVDFVDWSAFLYCSGLTSITIPASVDTLDGYAFYGCTGLTAIYDYSAIPTYTHDNSTTFGGVDQTACTLYVPANAISTYQSTYPWYNFTNIVSITPVSSITISGGSAITKAGGTLQLLAKVLPSNADTIVLWSVNKAAATIDANTGVLTAVANGTVIVTATATDGSGAMSLS